MIEIVWDHMVKPWREWISSLILRENNQLSQTVKGQKLQNMLKTIKWVTVMRLAFSFEPARFDLYHPHANSVNNICLFLALWYYNDLNLFMLCHFRSYFIFLYAVTGLRFHKYLSKESLLGGGSDIILSMHQASSLFIFFCQCIKLTILNHLKIMPASFFLIFFRRGN